MTNVTNAIALHKQGLSMAEIGRRLGVSSAWVCKAFKRAGYVIERETNASAFSKEDVAFLIANKDKPRKWLAEQIGRSAQSVSQWMQKRGMKIGLSPAEKKLADIQCAHCGVTFKPKQSSQTFCSIACMGAAKQVHGKANCLVCGAEFQKPNARQKFCSPECGQEGYQMQHIAVHPYEYKGIKMRSTWEVKFAAWLDSKELTWRYEPNFFALPGKKRYAPDFYVVEHDAYYEVKGWMKLAAAEKIRQFRLNYPEHTLVLVNKAVLKLYGIKV